MNVVRPQRGVVQLTKSGQCSGIEGTQEVIAAIERELYVTKLDIGFQNLGDACYIQLFKYLCSLDPEKDQLETLNLRYLRMGDSGLSALSDYLINNTTLKALNLQGNMFGHSDDVTSTFVAALNSSHVERLYLAGKDYGPSFMSQMLKRLGTPYLSSLYLANMGLHQDSVVAIAEYISSSRCRLRSLALDGHMFVDPVEELIAPAMERNYTLRRIDSGLKDKYKITSRNIFLHRSVTKEALLLLRHARIILYQPPRKLCAHSDSTRLHEHAASSYSPLPTEILLHILSCLSPTLSEAQRIRIFQYASDPGTLPPLLPRLTTSRCLADPSMMPSLRRTADCDDGWCMGASLTCRRDAEVASWLRSVGCDAFDPAGIPSKWPPSSQD